jgi:hypothetical protein
VGLPSCGCCCLDSRGVVGGVLIMWDRRVVEKIDECGVILVDYHL